MKVFKMNVEATVNHLRYGPQVPGLDSFAPCRVSAVVAGLGGATLRPPAAAPRPCPPPLRRRGKRPHKHTGELSLGADQLFIFNFK